MADAKYLICACGQPWLPAAGLYGTTEETECPGCVLRRMLARAEGEVTRLRALLNTPQLVDFATAVQIEAAHQRERWGADHDAGKTPADWYWLLGYLAGKALHAAVAGNTAKALHHTISSAAALANWHAAILGTDTRMRLGLVKARVAELATQEAAMRGDVEALVDELRARRLTHREETVQRAADVIEQLQRDLTEAERRVERVMAHLRRISCYHESLTLEQAAELAAECEVSAIAHAHAMADTCRRAADQRDVVEERAQQLAAELADALAESKRLRHELATFESAETQGRWIWSETDPNDLDTMCDEMLLTMTARQLRVMIAKAKQKSDEARLTDGVQW